MRSRVYVTVGCLIGVLCVRGVDGSCAKHFTVEFYAVVMLLTFILIIISIPSPLQCFDAVGWAAGRASGL